MPVVTPGSVWVSRRGKHTGNFVQVVKLTGADRVVVRRLGSEGDGWNKAKSDAAGVQTLGRDVFLANYAPKEALAATGTHGGAAFRRRGSAQGSLDTAVSNAINSEAPVPLRPQQSVDQAGLHLEVDTITPDLARAWLDRGGANRKLVERRVEILVAAIRRGEWRLTGEAIKLDSDGRVRDGQHRLEAIFRAGIPVQSVVVRNVEEDAFDVMDTGRSRTAADVLGIHGIVSRNETASAARGLILIERFGRLYHPGRDIATTPTPKEILAYTLEHRETLEAAVRLAANLTQGGFIGGGGLWATALTLLLRTDPVATEEYVSRLVEGDNLTRDSPILKLRNMFRASRTNWDNSQKGRESIVAMILKAWNLWRRGERIQSLSWRSDGRGAESFPVPE